MEAKMILMLILLDAGNGYLIYLIAISLTINILNIKQNKSGKLMVKLLVMSKFKVNFILLLLIKLDILYL